MLKSKLNLVLGAALFASSAALFFTQAQFAQAADATPASASTLRDVLLSADATQKQKADACRELARIGNKDAVSALASLLGDEKLSHMARYGLETIPDPAVDEALRAALGQVKGRLLAGVIGSLGVRKDVQAITPVSKFLQDPDPDVAQAAARALGSIGTSAAANAIANALDSTPAGNQLAFCEGLFRCAEALTKAGERDQAIGIYDRLAKVQNIHQVRAGALRGGVLARQEAGLPLLMQAIRSDDFVLVDAAARTALEMPGSAVTKAIADEIGKLPADKQILLTLTLGRRGDAEALPALYALAKNGSKPVRLAAIRAIPELKQPSSAPTLIALTGDSEGDVAKAAQEALAGLQGSEVDSAILAMLNGNDNDQRVMAADLVARRRMASAMPDLLRAAGASDSKVRQVALKRMGELGSEQNLPALLEFLMQAKGGQEIDAAEQAISTVCTRASQPQACTDQVAGALAKSQGPQKSALLRVLSAIGGTKALQTVRSSVDDSNPEVHSAAIRALGSWESADAAPHLLQLARSSTDSKDKMLCLRSYLSLASTHTELPADRRLAMCKDAVDLAQKPEEKKLLLSALGSVTSVESLTLITPYLEDSATKEEAAAAVVTISEKLLKQRDSAKVAPTLIPVLQQVVKVTANESLGKRANTALQQAAAKRAPKAL